MAKPKIQLTQGDKDHCLLQACELPNLDYARLALAAGANVNVVDGHGYTPLHWAVRSDDLTIIRLLLDHHADLSARNNDGKTACDLAVANYRGLAQDMLKDASQPARHASRVTKGRTDKGPPQVGG